MYLLGCRLVIFDDGEQIKRGRPRGNSDRCIHLLFDVGHHADVE